MKTLLLGLMLVSVSVLDAKSGNNNQSTSVSDRRSNDTAYQTRGTGFRYGDLLTNFKKSMVYIPKGTGPAQQKEMLSRWQTRTNSKDGTTSMRYLGYFKPTDWVDVTNALPGTVRPLCKESTGNMEYECSVVFEQKSMPIIG